MDHLQIPIEANDPRRKQRCNERMEKLKATQFPSQDASSLPGLVNEKIFGENIMIFELYEAVENGKVDRFVDVLEQVSANKELPLSAIFDQVTQAGDSLLHVAAYLGREQIAELIAYHFPGLLTRRNIRGDTALHVAARSTNSDVIKVILSQYEVEQLKNAEKDKEITRLTNENGDTALHEAVCSRHLGGVSDLLLADSPMAHYLNKSGRSPLYLAVLTGDVEILDLLLQIPFPPNESLPRCQGNSPLHAAILEKKPGRNTKGHLPIHLACKRGHVKVVEELLQQEWPNPRVLLNKKGQNILHVAAKSGENDVVKYLLRNRKIDRFTINEKDVNGNTPLHLAARNLFLKSLYFLTRDERIDVNLVNNEGLTARDIARLRSKVPVTFREHLSLMILISAGVTQSEKVSSMLRRIKHEFKTDWAKDRVYTLMVVAILITTVTFAAGFTLPGSVYSSDGPDPHKRGMAVLVHKPMFQVFTVCNTIAMYSSTVGSFVLLWAQTGDFLLAVSAYGFALRMVVVALVTMSVAFMAAVRLVVSEVSWLADVVTIIGSFFLFLTMIVVSLLLFQRGVRLPLIRHVSDLCIMILISYAESYVKVLPKEQGKPELLTSGRKATGAV